MTTEETQLAGVFVTGGPEEPAIQVALPDPAQTRLGSVYRDETGQHWRLRLGRSARYGHQLRWRTVRAITPDTARTRRYTRWAGAALIGLLGIFWFNIGIDLVPGLFKGIGTCAAIALFAAGALWILDADSSVVVVSNDDGEPR
jgi:hypothetical protein